MTIIAVLPAPARPLLEPHLPPDIDAHWFASADEAFALAPTAEIGWFDMQKPGAVGQAVGLGEKLKWVSTIFAGLDSFPLPLLAERGVKLTNSVGINANAVAEYAVMGVLVVAKRFDQVVRAHDRAEWMHDSPGKTEVAGTAALVIGYGAIGRAIGDRLKAFGVAVTGVRRSAGGEAGVIGPDEWHAKVGDFDWIVMAAPATADNGVLFGAAEIAAMRRDAWLINIARGTLIDQAALIEALREKRIGGAFLDVTDPEPLPADSPLWTLPNSIVTMHLSGRSQDKMFPRAATLFLANLDRYLKGESLENEVDLALGY